MCVCVCMRARVRACAHMHVLNLSSPTLRSPVDYSLPGSSVHGILQARILEWVAAPDPPPVDLPDSEIKSASQADSLALSHLGSPQVTWEDPKSRYSLLTDKKDSKLVL